MSVLERRPREVRPVPQELCGASGGYFDSSA